MKMRLTFLTTLSGLRMIYHYRCLSSLQVYEGNFWNLSTKSEQLEWRRAKVVEMRARGMTHEEIARELQVSRASISSDIQYLRS